MRAIHNFAQGSAPWHQHRLAAFNASEAPAVMGASKYTSRSELLRQKATGTTPEVSPATQALFDRGHAVEAPTVAMIEEVIGDSLAPVVASILIDGMTLGASYDGLSLMEDVGCEIKLWNEDLARQIRSGVLDMHYVWQLEQQFIVTPSLERIIFATSDGTPERFVWMEYRPVKGRPEQLIAAWRQFAADLAAYTPPAAEPLKPTGRAPESLPALRIEVTGTVTASNLDAFKEHALAVFSGINRTLTTDTDFADAEKTVKWCGDVEDRLKAAKQHALSQTQSIDALFRAIDEIGGEARTVRLELDKLVKAEKERRRGEIVAGGVKALQDYTQHLNRRIGKPFLPPTAAHADFGGAIKGMKSLASMEDKVATELARAKIAANEIADRIQANMDFLREGVEQGNADLFPDLGTLALKAADDFRAVVAQRITARKEAQEAERARIRAEEEARATAKARAEQEAREAEERRQRAAADEAQRKQAQPALLERAREIVADIEAAEVLRDAIAPAAGPAVIPMPTRAPAAPVGQPTLRLLDINRRLAPLSIDDAGLTALGFPPAATEKNAKLRHESSWKGICAAIAQHVVAVANAQKAA